MQNKAKISAVINIKNEGNTLDKCLKSIRNFVDEIIIIDMQSTDNGPSIAAKYGALIIPYKPQKAVELARNFALKKATGRWILLLDPDEYLPKTLIRELKRITERSDIDFIKIPRKNIIFGKWIRHSNCWPDYLIRFFKKGFVTWNTKIHSQPETHGNGLTLLDSEKLAIRHINYRSVAQYITRAVRYSGVQADELKFADYKIKTSDFILKPIQEFNSRFFSAAGYKDGIHGLVFSILQTFSVALIYIRLWEKQGSSDKVLSKESFVSASQESLFEYSYWFTKYFREEYSKNLLKNYLIKIRHVFSRLTKNF
jgi:(heptosyl)LPS beta-1,4-glucosyltransferase